MEQTESAFPMGQNFVIAVCPYTSRAPPSVRTVRCSPAGLQSRWGPLIQSNTKGESNRDHHRHHQHQVNPPVHEKFHPEIDPRR